MFDWNDQDQEGEPIWSQFTEAEDHIVPYPKGAEDNLLLGFRDYSKKQKNEEESTDIRTSKGTSEHKNDISGSIQDNKSTLNATGLSAAKLDMGSWPDLPSLNVALGERCSDANDQDTMTTDLIDDFSRSPNLNNMRVQLDTEPEASVNDHEDKESDCFLDCEWANIGDFGDFDRIFSNNESIFGHECIDTVGDFLSNSDVITNTATSIPAMPSSREQTCLHGSFLFYEPFASKKQVEKKAIEKPIVTGGQSGCITHDSMGYQGDQTESFEKPDNKKIQSKSCKKPDEGASASQNIDGTYANSVHELQQLPSPSLHAFARTPFQTCQIPEPSQKMQIDACNGVGQLRSLSSYMFSDYGYTMYPLTAVPVLQHGRSEAKEVSFGYEASSDLVNRSISVDKPSVVPSRPTMTPQEKIEKLRRRQQMQALLAVQQQQQQFEHHIAANDVSIPQKKSPRKKSEEAITNDAVENLKHSSLELNILVVQDETPIISTVSDDHTLVEFTYYQLQEALRKLDIKIRLSIRDSLFRLAQSAKERQSASDRSSTNKSNQEDGGTEICDETEKPRRVAKSHDAETGTNPIDRTVAHLLFHKPSESLGRHVKEEIELLNMLNPASNPSVNADHNMVVDDQENIGEMAVGLSV